MSVIIETLENLERKIVLSLPWDGIKAETDKRLQQTQRRVKINGFRPGKAPLKMVASIYGNSVQNEVLNDYVQKMFYDVAEVQNLKIAGLPRFEHVEEQNDEHALKIAAVFEVFPEITINDLSSETIEKIIAEVGDAEIDKTIEILRKQRTRFEAVDREAQNGDRVIIDFEGKINGNTFNGGNANNYPFVLGQGQMLPEFESGILGLKASESKEVEVHFPDNYHGSEVAGKTAVFTITLQNVSAPVLPEVDEQFAKSLGIETGSLSQMREEIHKNVVREITRRTENQTKEAVMEILLKTTNILLPQVLVNDEASRLAEEAKQNLIKQGADISNVDWSDDIFKTQAERRVALGLIIAKLVEDYKLQPTEAQIKAVVENIATSYEDPQEVVNWYFADRQRLQNPTSLAIEANVVDFVLNQAKVTEKTLPFDEVIGVQV